MERVLSQDERIRRAEEIYARKIQAQNRTSATVNVEDGNNNRLTRKLITQFIICVILYISFYALKSSPDLLSQDIMYKISDVLEYDINIQELYKNINAYINSKTETKGKNTNNILNEENKENEADINSNENQEVQENAENIEQVQDTGLIQETLSATENTQTNETSVEENITEESSSVNQMQIDAEYIKANYSIVKPLEGEITSRFGLRNPSVATVPKYHTGIDIARVSVPVTLAISVPKYHTGIDIARVTGTVITAAMEGTVELVSSQGDYGNHVKITNGEVSTLYAHCSKIYVNQGDTITQGQQIAEVGATGNVTGPHLHFEIRRNNQYVDPDLILQF